MQTDSGFNAHDIQFITELLQKNIEHCGEKDCPECNLKAFTAGYNYARKEMKQWAEEKVGENHDRLLQELLEELK